ncbi:DEAD/DEAH box helicase [Pilimelia columellifera]|uniref:DEAD/DEAH box helicase n=1 Tax=Pilimelia columellifera subsp. columellifera TaxID=706583 RepID=A0ABN3MXI6_9ACTN
MGTFCPERLDANPRGRHSAGVTSAPTSDGTPTAAPFASELLDRLTRRVGRGALLHVVEMAARPGEATPWPDWTPPQLRAAYAARGVSKPWRHQAEAAELAHRGDHLVIATGTASGKSLAYQLPVLSTLLTDPRATALYLSPTKALAADQLGSLTGLDLADVRPAGYDGDTPRDERDWARQHSRLVLTNPDMLHHGILPGHRGWASFLRRLRYVVIDECHSYRGVFGTHVAHVLRRLRRLTGPQVTFVLASATTGDPAGGATRLTGLPVRAVSVDGSPRAAVTFALWEPPLLPGGLDGQRRSALTEAADLLADTIIEGRRALAFVRSRRGAEVVARATAGILDEAVAGLGARVAAYRSGLLPEERRDIERRLRSGELLGVASTNALELGVDITGLDAVIMCGYPGTRASMWQQAGRAGRRGQDAVAVLIARDDPLDNYLVHHPDALFERPVEATVLDPTNPYVLGPQLCAAAAERPLTADDIDLFGGAVAAATVKQLVTDGALRRRPTGWYWTHRGRPDVDLRGSGGQVTIVESATGRLLGLADTASASYLLHPGAVYLHQGSPYLVETLDLESDVALVRAEAPDWSTHARDVTSLTVTGVRRYRDAGPVGLFLGDVQVTNQVVSYQRRRLSSREVIDTRPLDLPARNLRTVAVWFTASTASLAGAGIDIADTAGALHAAEHAAIGLLPLVATCDRWDIGGLSTVAHVDTDAPTVFVYDGQPGGAGFAERAYEVAPGWLTATRDTIAECGCATGCPSCVQSPKCGNGNNPLAKDAAISVLDVVLQALAGR